MIKDEQWPIARLIPISSASGIEAQERRVASALLAVIGAVPEFGRALLKPFGAPAGNIEAFIEVPFKINGRSIRPDGIIVVTRGSKAWGTIVETKVGSAPLDPQQIDAYLDLARELSFDAVLSISNHYVTSSSEYPIDVDRRKLRRVALHHWSWIDVLTEAVVQKEHRGVSDPDQAYILNELIRYLSDPRSGAVAFDSMGPSWTKVRDGAREHTLRKGDVDAGAVAARWDDLIRYLGLELTKDLGRDVKQVLAKQERTPAARQSALRDALASHGRLYAELQVPNVTGPLEIMADLRARQITASTRIDAPREGRSKGRVSWLLRQLQNAPDSLKVEVRIARTSSTLAANFGEVRETPEILYPEASREIRQFVVSFTRNMGLKRDASKGSFIDSVISTAKDFYADVLQNLRAWKAAPPKLRKAAEQEPEHEPEERVVELPPRVEEAIDRAAEEIHNEASEGTSSKRP
jgi:hypothetical protein